MSPRAEIALKLSRDRVLAHAVLFPLRHADETPLFHREMILSWYSPVQHVGWLVFRGGAKSTRAEEALIIEAGFREFHNGIIVGDTFDRAAERLVSIKHEIDTNSRLEELFGNLHGPVWADDEIVLSNGVRILAMGRGQSIRGIKFNSMRPDRWLWDDIENEDSLRTPEARAKTLRWFVKEILPAGDPSYRGRMMATPGDAECLPLTLAAEGSGWLWKTYPIEHKGKDGERVATWPARFPLVKVDEIRKNYARTGTLSEFNMEYMCVATSQEDKPFKREMLKIEPQVRSWHAVYCMFDPARTVSAKSATTGYAAWSWIANKLVVWDAWGKMLMPDEIVSALFQANEDFQPAYIGIEKTGLAEFLMQPIRHEMLRRRITLPVRGVEAPKGKLDFIRGLQPFFNAREIVFAKDLPDLRNQLLSFPTGHIDVPNALAYALKMRPGAPMYEDFGLRNVSAGLELLRGRPAWLALNAATGYVAGVLAQVENGTMRICCDWVYEGDPADQVKNIVDEAKLECGTTPLRVAAGPVHFDRWNNFGIVQAIRKIPADVRQAAKPEDGRDYVRGLLRKEVRGFPALTISDEARWTLNGFAGGYCRGVDKRSILTDFAEEGVYRTLMEGLESFAGLLKAGGGDDEDVERNYGYTAQGQRYLSSLPQR